jgi:hypothetical protein
MPGVNFDWKINAPSAIYTFLSAAAGILVAFMLLQSKVEAIVSRIANLEVRIEKVEIAREVDRVQRQNDRDAFLRMEGDLRVIRQIVEGLKPPGATR